MLIYLDSNIYSYIQACSEESPVDAWIRSREAYARVSELHLREAWACHTPEERRDRVRLLCSLGPGELEQRRLPSLARVLGQELVDELRRVQPLSLRSSPALKRVSGAAALDRERWEDACHEPGVMPWRDRELAPHIHEAIQGSEAVQKEYRRGLRVDPPPLLQESASDRASRWRENLAVSLQELLSAGEADSHGVSEWVRPYLRRFDGSAAAEFARNADPRRMPRHYAFFRAQELQLYHRVNRGNLIDCGHVVMLMRPDVEFVVTADRRFRGILLVLAHECQGLATVAPLVDRSRPSALGELRRVLPIEG